MSSPALKTAAVAAGAVSFLTWTGRLKRIFPAFAFFGGFLWDAFTLGRAITSLDLFLLLGYLTGAALLLIWLGRRAARAEASAGAAPAGTAEGALKGAGGEAAEAAGAGAAVPANAGTEASGGRWAAWKRTLLEDGPELALQFFFGGLFSALVIFYFLSSSYLPGFLLVLGLAVLLAANEFLEGHYRRFTLSWTLFATCAILFLNFALPHLFRSVHAVWFYISTALGYGLVVLLKRASPQARGSLRPAAGVAIALVGLHFFNGIPPVPLVKKDLLICREMERKQGRYTARIEEPPFWAPWRNTDRHVRQRPGEKVFCYTSVFLPPGITTTLYHVWQHRDPKSGKWVTHSRIGFPIAGGRKDGYRGYTYKRNLAPGRWQVRIETGSGRVLGLNRFTVESLPQGVEPAFKDLILH